MTPFIFLGIAIPVALIAHVVGRRLAALIEEGPQ